MTLAEFLLARIAEDEALASAASPGPWHTNPEQDQVLAVDDITVADGFALSGRQMRATSNHIARHDPARVLAECEAKRLLVAEILPTNPDYDPRYVQKVLALPYADHPDYDEAWRP